MSSIHSRLIFVSSLKDSFHVFWLFYPFYFQPGVGRNGRVLQGYPPIIEAREEDEEDEEEEEDEAMSVSLSSERNQTVNLRDTAGKSPLSRPSQKTAGQSSKRSQRKIQEITLTTLDPSNLSPRWIWLSMIFMHVQACVPVTLCCLCLFLSFCYKQIWAPLTAYSIVLGEI